MYFYKIINDEFLITDLYQIKKIGQLQMSDIQIQACCWCWVLITSMLGASEYSSPGDHLRKKHPGRKLMLGIQILRRTLDHPDRKITWVAVHKRQKVHDKWKYGALADFVDLKRWCPMNENRISCPIMQTYLQCILCSKLRYIGDRRPALSEIMM